jgi:hypothetical protein
MVTQALNRLAQRHAPDTPRWTKGQKVWLNAKNLTLPYGTIKLAPRRHGPFVIEEVRSPIVYKLCLPPQWNIHPVFHASLLMPYVETVEHRENYSRPPPDMIEGEEQYEVEAIRAHRHHRRKLQYLIKWKGYPESDNTWEPVDNVQAPLLIRKYHETHPLKDKRPAKRARVASSPTTTPQPNWPLDSDLPNTYEGAATATAAAAATTPPTPEQQPPNPNASQPSHSERCSATKTSTAPTSLLSSAKVRYLATAPSFVTTSSYSPSHPSVTLLTSIASSTSASARTPAAQATDKCLPHPTPTHPMKNVKRRRTHPASPQCPTTASPSSWKSRRLQHLPPSHSPLSLIMSRTPRQKTTAPSQALSTSSGQNTRRSCQHRLRPSSPSTLRSMPPSAPQPLGLPPLFASERHSTLRSSPRPTRRSTDSSRSTSSDRKTTGSCELDWASSAFPMVSSVTRAESPPESLQTEARWWSQNGSGWLGMGEWNYWPGGSLGNPPTSQTFSSGLTILRPH